MNKPGLCCISLELKDQGYSFQTMTYKRFSTLPRQEALEILAGRILNNLQVTNETIRYCGENDWCYRVSSDIFPLITYDKAAVSLEDLPNHDLIQDEFDNIEQTIIDTGVRVSVHPDQFNILASINEETVSKTVDELNFFSSFLDRIGCSADHNTPINIHIQNSKNGTRQEISERFLKNFYRLDENCQRRIVVENDDREVAWSVAKLLDIFYPITNIPITYDSHHFRLNNPENISTDSAVSGCMETWKNTRPLFHFSNGRDHKLDKAHSDYVHDIHSELFTNNINVDFEYKLKDLTIKKFLESYSLCEYYPEPIVAVN